MRPSALLRLERVSSSSASSSTFHRWRSPSFMSPSSSFAGLTELQGDDGSFIEEIPSSLLQIESRLETRSSRELRDGPAISISRSRRRRRRAAALEIDNARIRRNNARNNNESGNNVDSRNNNTAVCSRRGTESNCRRFCARGRTSRNGRAANSNNGEELPPGNQERPAGLAGPVEDENIGIPPRPNAHFTLWEHIQMIGARNFFVPPPQPRSSPCIECYKRGAFYLCMLLIVTGLFFLWNAILHPMQLMGRTFFVGQHYKNMFLTNDIFYPEAAMFIIYVTIIVAGFAVHYTNRPAYDQGFILYLHSARALILLGFTFLFWHIWAHALYYPDESFSTVLEATMRKTLEVAIDNKNSLSYMKERRTLPFENMLWRDTQTVFKCCGLHDFHDWIPHEGRKDLGGPVHNISKYLPRSCCEKLSGGNCEAMYVHPGGCLQAQVKLLETETIWVVNPGLFVSVLSHFALYLVLGRLFSTTAALNRTRRPFEPPPPQPPEMPDPPQNPVPI